MFLCKTCKNTYKILLIMKKGYKQVNKKISNEIVGMSA